MRRGPCWRTCRASAMRGRKQRHRRTVRGCDPVGDSETFPGALVPVIDSAGSMQIDVAAPTMSDWRRLKPVLLAFAGPTLTGFDGVPEPFAATDPIGARLTAAPRPPSPRSCACRRMIARASRLCALSCARATHLPARPNCSARPRSRPLGCWRGSRTISMSVAATRPPAFSSASAANSASMRSTSNFSRSSCSRPSRIGRRSSRLRNFQACASRGEPRRSPRSSWRRCIEPTSPAVRRRECRRHARCVRGFGPVFVQSMLIAGAPPGLRAGGWRLLGLEAISDPGRQDLLAILADRAQDLGWIADLLPARAAVAPQSAKDRSADRCRA